MTTERRFVSPTLRDWIAANAPDDIVGALVDACADRGKRKGRVLASVPTKKGPRVVGAWRSLMSCLSVNRAGMFALMFASDEERETFEACERWMRDYPRAFDVVRLAGGAPLEFNMFHWQLSGLKVNAFAALAGIDPDACGASWYERGRDVA